MSQPQRGFVIWRLQTIDNHACTGYWKALESADNYFPYVLLVFVSPKQDSWVSYFAQAGFAAFDYWAQTVALS